MRYTAGKGKCKSCDKHYEGKRGWKHTIELGLLCRDCARAKGIDPDLPGIKLLTKKSIETW